MYRQESRCLLTRFYSLLLLCNNAFCIRIKHPYHHPREIGAGAPGRFTKAVTFGAAFGVGALQIEVFISASVTGLQSKIYIMSMTL